MIKYLIFLIYLSVFTTAWAASDFPDPFTAHYTLYARGLPIGKGVRRLIYLENGNIVFESTSHTTGILSLVRDDNIHEHSFFQLINGQPRPRRYEYHHLGSKKQKHETIEFNWQQGIAKGQKNGHHWEVALEPQTVDQLLYQIVVMQSLQQGKRKIHYKIVDDGKIKTYSPQYLGQEKVKTGQGAFQTVKYQRVADNGERQTTLWCAPRLHYLPVKVIHNEKGEKIELRLETVDGL